MKPYLIQRAKFQKECTYSPTRKGIDSMLDFDYMGSAEFEFGTLSNSLNRIGHEMSNYCLFSTLLNNFKINIFCNKNNYKDVYRAIRGLADNKFRLKEYCDFSDWIYSKINHRNSDFWWDIKNDYMFWKFNTEFNTKFEKLINEK